MDNKESNGIKHQSVLVSEVLQYLDLKDGGVYLDVTFGGGGHSRAILEANPTVKVIGLDWDQRSLDLVAPSFQEEFKDRVKLIWGNFAHLYRIFKDHKLDSVDGILADFGTSQHQIFNHPGFSFNSDSFLDMRMSKGHSLLTAAEVLNSYTEDALSKILFDFGEESAGKRIAKSIVEFRKKKRISSSQELAQIVSKVKGDLPFYKIHPATKTFQALRVYVNNEMANINSFLKSSLPVLKPGSRILCISFHSLEDRAVKEFFKEKEAEGILKNLTKKPIAASELELKNNLSSRSAKLRVAEKV